MACHVTSALDFNKRGSIRHRGGAGTAGNPVQVGNTTFM